MVESRNFRRAMYKVDGESEFTKGNYTKVCFEIYFETG